ncbi:MAG TPA: hypothetical protein DD379_11795 [Cyanobacteria bacterium UBA11162]|nr:hypothetical protein [Cyanobacteria bacterium UBA11162]
MLKFFTTFYNGFLDRVKSLLGSFDPPNSFSWQTLIMLSLFSVFMAWLATGLMRDLLAHFGCIFLILGVYWGTTANKALRIGDVPLSPWITGAITSIYIFRAFVGELSPKALIAWPLISAVIAALPPCLDENFKPKIPPKEKRQNLALLLTSQLILSCWFQFYFVVQNWLMEYPTLLTDNFRQSAFVVQVGTPPSVARLPRGVSILDLTTSKLQKELNNKPWSDVERILLPQEREKLFNQISVQVKEQIASTRIKEDEFWQVEYKNPSIRGSGYNLELQALWQGPRSQSEPYFITKSCQITPVNRQRGEEMFQVSLVKCEPASGWGVRKSFVATQ